MLVGCSSSSSSSANASSDSSRKRRTKPHRRQAQIAEVFASFANELSNLEAYRNEDPETVAAELALLEELPLANDTACATMEGTTLPLVSELVGGASSCRGVEDIPLARRENSLAGHSKVVAWDALHDEHGRKSDVMGGVARSTRETCKGILSSSVVQAFVYDYAMMKRSIRDYDVSLRLAIAEAERLRTEVADMRCACSEVEQLHEALVSEMTTQTELHEENAQLVACNEALRSAIQDALEVDGDIEGEAFIDALVNENAMLWSLAHLSQTASRMSSSALQVPPPASPSLQNRQSLSSRSRTSSSSTHSSLTPSRASPGSPLRQGDSPHSPPREIKPELASPGDNSSIAIAANVDETGQMPLEALAHKAIAALQGRQTAIDGAASNLVDGSRKLIGNTGKLTSGTGVGSGGLGFQHGLDSALDEDEMSEVSSLVESAIFLASPTVEAHSPRSEAQQENELSPAAAIAGAVGRALASSKLVESKAPSGQGGTADSPKS